MRHYGTNRYICEVLEELRKCHETHNYSMMLSLTEEIQTMANRMEAGLGDVNDIKELSEERSKLKVEVNKLRQKVDKLKTQLPKKGKKS